MLITLKNKDTLHFKNFFFKCAIGKNGLTFNKKEGDKKTPKGTFNLDKLYYRKDRIKKHKTKLNCIPILKSMGWCDDVSNQKNYNKLIKFPFKFKAEKLYLKENIYDVIVVLNYNMKPIIPNKGSAIFLHLAKKNYRSTEGCIAISKKDMRLLLSKIKKETFLCII